jgi:tRNA G18 (ribose-2'-O)-methylase SpoU
MPHVRQFVKESCRTVNGFEMRDIILLDPHCIDYGRVIIRKTEVKDIFWMRVADRKTKSRPADQLVKEGYFVAFTHRHLQEDIIIIDTGGDNRQRVSDRQRISCFIANLILH